MSRKFCALNLLSTIGNFIWVTSWLTIGYGFILKNPNKPFALYYSAGCMMIGIVPILVWLLSMVKIIYRQDHTSHHVQ